MNIAGIETHIIILVIKLLHQNCYWQQTLLLLIDRMLIGCKASKNLFKVFKVYTDMKTSTALNNNLKK
jgi:hypothetical protein